MAKPENSREQFLLAYLCLQLFQYAISIHSVCTALAMLNYNPTSDCIKLIGTLTMTCLLCRVRSFLSPANPGVTAAEALPAPFFTFVQGDEVLLEV